jgi:hypothetical protein
MHRPRSGRDVVSLHLSRCVSLLSALSALSVRRCAQGQYQWLFAAPLSSSLCGGPLWCIEGVDYVYGGERECVKGLT